MYTIQMNGPSLRGKPYQVNTFSFSSAPIQAFGSLSVPAQKRRRVQSWGWGRKCVSYRKPKSSTLISSPSNLQGNKHDVDAKEQTEP